ASVIVSDVPIVVQHTRLDSRQAELALLSTMAFPAGKRRPYRTGLAQPVTLARAPERHDFAPCGRRPALERRRGRGPDARAGSSRGPRLELLLPSGLRFRHAALVQRRGGRSRRVRRGGG